jgi:hypothetical protein
MRLVGDPPARFDAKDKKPAQLLAGLSSIGSIESA